MYVLFELWIYYCSDVICCFYFIGRCGVVYCIGIVGYFIDLVFFRGEG